MNEIPNEAESLYELEHDVIATYWQRQHEDGGSALQSSMTLIDSGYKPTSRDGIVGVYEFTAQMQAKGLKVWPAKGSNTALDVDYRASVLGKNTASPGHDVDLRRHDSYSTLAREPTDERRGLLFGLFGIDIGAPGLL